MEIRVKWLSVAVCPGLKLISALQKLVYRCLLCCKQMPLSRWTSTPVCPDVNLKFYPDDTGKCTIVYDKPDLPETIRSTLTSTLFLGLIC